MNAHRRTRRLPADAATPAAPAVSSRPLTTRVGVLTGAALLTGAGLYGFWGATSASATDLPERTPQEVLTALQESSPTAVSGTVTWRADLGLPDLGGAMGGAELTNLLSGESTLRVWSDGERSARVDLLGAQDERSVVTNGTDVWAWSGGENAATHATLPDAAELEAQHADMQAQLKLPPEAEALANASPQELAATLVEDAETVADLRVDEQVRVAGRDAYELVVDPHDEATRIGEVRLAVDGQTGVPLRVQVISAVTGEAAIEVGFSRVEFAQPDADVFDFTPPAGAQVEELGELNPHDMHEMPAAELPADATGDAAGELVAGPGVPAAPEPRVVGEGPSAILVADLGALPAGPADTFEPAGPTEPEGPWGPHGESGEDAASEDMASAGLETVLAQLPQRETAVGTVRVLDGPLVSAVLTQDGRVAVGAVAPEALVDALVGAVAADGGADDTATR